MPFDGKTVVVTHHAPHPISIAPRYARDALNPAFASDLTDVISQHQPDLWVHGHTHSSFDYVVPGTKTRVVCNPMGYDDENPSFDVGLVVEL
jgi:Icc-related predicted phosphoesterase